jgi:hypothetical protein
MKANEKFIPWDELTVFLEDLKLKCDAGDSVEIKLSLKKAVTEFAPELS